MRPLPAGRIAPSDALWFGVLLSVVGGLYLALLVNLLASALAMITLATYLFIYTPLKRETPLCTLVGAIPGAVPPLIGWAGARGTLDLDAWLLYAIVFFWQFPHFMSIAWMYRDDYARGGYLTLPRGKRRRAIHGVADPDLFPRPSGRQPHSDLRAAARRAVFDRSACARLRCSSTGQPVWCQSDRTRPRAASSSLPSCIFPRSWYSGESTTPCAR